MSLAVPWPLHRPPAGASCAVRAVEAFDEGSGRPLQFVNALNKMARTAWALLAHGGTYRAPELC
jgi:hypothetical protein